MKTEMKHIASALASGLVMLSLSGCGFDDPAVEYPTKSVLFTYQQYNRELVVGEGLKFKLGVVFAGEAENSRNRSVKYVIDESLVPSGYTLMPPEYYTCSDPSEIIVPKGSFKGYMPVTIDSLKFLADPVSMTGKYVIPFRITAADADTITAGKDYMVLQLKYLARQFGYYQYSGTRRNVDTGEEESYSYVSSENTSVRQLVTSGPAQLKMTADPYSSSSDPARKDGYSLILDVPVNGGGVIGISSGTPDVSIVPDGDSTYDEAEKKFTLRYQYVASGITWAVQETLKFRNRIRDDQGNGVKINEWRGF